MLKICLIESILYNPWTCKHGMNIDWDDKSHMWSTWKLRVSVPSKHYLCVSSLINVYQEWVNILLLIFCRSCPFSNPPWLSLNGHWPLWVLRFLYWLPVFLFLSTLPSQIKSEAYDVKWLLIQVRQVKQRGKIHFLFSGHTWRLLLSPGLTLSGCLLSWPPAPSSLDQCIGWEAQRYKD